MSVILTETELRELRRVLDKMCELAQDETRPEWNVHFHISPDASYAIINPIENPFVILPSE